jgi:hypothetical protein
MYDPRYKLRPIMQELYKSDKDEIKSVGDWIKFAAENNARIDEKPNQRKVKIFIGTESCQVVLRELEKI